MRGETMSVPFSKTGSRSIRWNSPIGWSVAFMVALGALVWPAASTWLWVTFFLIASGLSGNSYLERCGRVHCRISGPLFLLCAVYLATVQLGLVPFIGNAWFVAIALGVVALSFAAELIVGPTLGS
jgi:hypothetical protein